MARARVAILLGSDSDWTVMEVCYTTLRELDVPARVEILSAHRTPDKLRESIFSFEEQGIEVFIAGAGMSAALPGAVAAYTARPVIGVPLASGPLQGVDSLLSMVQMPPGVPVATMAIGAAGAKNAALLATQMLALGDPRLAEALKKFKSIQVETVDKKNQTLRERHGLG